MNVTNPANDPPGDSHSLTLSSTDTQTEISWISDGRDALKANSSQSHPNEIVPAGSEPAASATEEARGSAGAGSELAASANEEARGSVEESNLTTPPEAITGEDLSACEDVAIKVQADDLTPSPTTGEPKTQDEGPRYAEDSAHSRRDSPIDWNGVTPHVAGLTERNLERLIINNPITRRLLSDPSVTDSLDTQPAARPIINETSEYDTDSDNLTPPTTKLTRTRSAGRLRNMKFPRSESIREQNIKPDKAKLPGSRGNSVVGTRPRKEVTWKDPLCKIILGLSPVGEQAMSHTQELPRVTRILDSGASSVLRNPRKGDLVVRSVSMNTANGKAEAVTTDAGSSLANLSVELIPVSGSASSGYTTIWLQHDERCLFGELSPEAVELIRDLASGLTPLPTVTGVPELPVEKANAVISRIEQVTKNEQDVTSPSDASCFQPVVVPTDNYDTRRLQQALHNARHHRQNNRSSSTPPTRTASPAPPSTSGRPHAPARWCSPACVRSCA